MKQYPGIMLVLAVVFTIGCNDSPTMVAPNPSNPERDPRPATHGAALVVVVTDTTDSGPGSLREALALTDAHAGRDSIHFNIPPGECPGRTCVIQPQRHPSLRAFFPVVIDGYTQPGSSENTSGPGQASNAVLKIELQGVNQTACADDSVLTLGNTQNFPAGNSVVRGLIINNYCARGLRFDYGDDFIVEGNYIGTDSLGSDSLGGSQGLFLFFSNNGLVGGTDPGSRNVILGNAAQVVGIGDDNRLFGNYLGVTADGGSRSGNGGIGFSGSRNQIGGNDPSMRNVIATPSSGIPAIQIGPISDADPSSGNVIEGNYLGLDHTGSLALGVGGGGIAFALSDRNEVLNNVVTGGILLTNENVVQGNLVGTDVTGMNALGDGVIVVLGDGNIIGDPDTLNPERNLITGNLVTGTHGVVGISGSNNLVVGNFIGTDVTGQNGLGARFGVVINSGGSDNWILENIIAYSRNRGVSVEEGVRNRISRNSIHSNTNLGIDLGGSGVTANDSLDDDVGPNGFQNFPVLTAVYSGGGTTTVVGSLNSKPNESFDLEFFANAVLDPLLHGEGEDFVGTTSVMTDAGGYTSFVFSFPTTVAIGDYLAATATGPEGTSEFSKTVEVEINPDDEGPLTTNVVADPNPAPAGSSFVLDALVDDTTTGGSIVASAEFGLDGGMTWSSMDSQDGVFDEVTEAVTVMVPVSEASVLEVCVRGTDALGNIGPQDCIMVAVFDPDGGFVTGGGWIDSPAGAYVNDPSLTGKATFGFVSKYKKGASVPTGNTQFRFKAGDLSFSSTTYEWLVVNQAGSNAQYKGSGTINDAVSPSGELYRFMLWAGDTDPDTFRIKIWYENGADVVVYDNAFDQAIGGGSIVIHQ